MKLKKILTIVFLLLFPFHLHANKITTVADGNWDDGTAWLNGNLPGYTFGDTVEINHCIFFNKNLQLNSGAFLTIKDSGKICGHHNIYLKPGSELDVFGRLYFDSMFVQGYLYIKNNNQVWIGQYITIYGGGHALVIGPGYLTNYPFICSCTFDSIPPLPQDTFTVDNDSAGIEIEVYPNPFHDFIHFKTNADINLVYLTDDRGRLIMRKEFADDFLDLRKLLPATYFLHLILSDGQTITKKVIKL